MQYLNWNLKTKLKKNECPGRQTENGGGEWEKEERHSKQKSGMLRRQGRIEQRDLFSNLHVVQKWWTVMCEGRGVRGETGCIGPQYEEFSTF